MSLILDALRKSEQENRNQSHPTDRRDLKTTAPNQVFLKSELLRSRVLLLLISCGILSAYLYHSSTTAPQKEKITENEQVELIPTLANDLEDKETMETIKTLLDDTSNIVDRRAVNQPSDRLTSPSPHNTLRISSSGTIKKVLSNDLQQIHTQSVFSNIYDVPHISTLKQEIQKEIPALKYQSHWYDEEKSKCNVIVNDEHYKEGAKLGPSLKLVQITSDGLILKLKATYFHLVKLESWPQKGPD